MCRIDQSHLAVFCTVTKFSGLCARTNWSHLAKELEGPEKNLAKRTSVYCITAVFTTKFNGAVFRKTTLQFLSHFKCGTLDQWSGLFNKNLVDSWPKSTQKTLAASIFFAKFSIPKTQLQRVLALCYLWDLEKFALAKIRISKIFILCTQ